MIFNKLCLAHIFYFVYTRNNFKVRAVEEVVAAKFVQSMEPDSRFTHLLRPIRDLTENWNIDIAKYLEDYLHEVNSCHQKIRRLQHKNCCRSFMLV